MRKSPGVGREQTVGPRLDGSTVNRSTVNRKQEEHGLQASRDAGKTICITAMVLVLSSGSALWAQPAPPPLKNVPAVPPGMQRAPTTAPVRGAAQRPGATAKQQE